MLSSIEFLIIAFLSMMLVAAFISNKTRFPYTMVLVFVGIFLTLVNSSSLTTSLLGPSVEAGLRAMVSEIQGVYAQLISGSGGGLFVALVVPPLLFEAMMHISSADLREVIRPSLVLATVGVVVAVLVGGLLLWLVAGLSVYVSFLFAALISPTDAATVLALFRKSRVPSRLATLVDTEAAFNDATGIVVFSIVLASVGLSKLPFLGAMETFTVTFGGGVVVGLGVAFLAEIVLSTLEDRVAETILTIFVVYGAYLLASAVGFSGLIAVAVVGIYFGNLTVRTAMGPATRESFGLFWEIAAFVGNSIAFLFIGFETSIVTLIGSIGIISVAYYAVLVARAASVYPILAVSGRRLLGLGGGSSSSRASEGIPSKWRNVVMLGGMRGALSIALVASIPVSAHVSPADINTIATMVLGVAFLSISLQAALLSAYVRRNFAEERGEPLETRLKRTLEKMENLQRLQDAGKISNKEFIDNLEKEKDELREVLGEIRSSEEPTEIIKSRASDLYATVIEEPRERAREALGLWRPEGSVEPEEPESESSGRGGDGEVEGRKKTAAKNKKEKKKAEANGGSQSEKRSS